MDFSFSKHAKERIHDRGLSQKIVSKTINTPDRILQKSECKQVFQKIVKENESTYLYRVFVNICKQPPLIITAYKTSKVDKYEY
jgi:hypothetical protein